MLILLLVSCIDVWDGFEKKIKCRRTLVLIKMRHYCIEGFEPDCTIYRKPKIYAT